MKPFRLTSFVFGKSYDDQDDFTKYILDEAVDKNPINGVKFEFVDLNKIYDSSPYITLMIGPNGTGKSTVLREISRIFISAHLRQSNDDRFLKSALMLRGEFELEYLIGDEKFSILTGGRFKFNNLSHESLKKIKLPKKVIVNTLGISDKFIVKASTPMSLNQLIPYTLDFYDYIGAKSENFSASNYGFIQRALDLLVESFSKKVFTKGVANVFTYLGFNPLMTVKYRIKKTVPRTGEIYSIRQVEDFDSLAALIKSVAIRRKQSIIWIDSIIYNTKLMYDILHYIKTVNNEKNYVISYKLDFYDTSETNLTTNDFQVIAVLRKLRLMEFEAINVFKSNGGTFDLSESSSGEIQILVSFLSMASVVEDGCLVLIDEPEISLHPNWQMRYMDLIYKVFGHFSNTHFIIATHSHFLVSDLRPEASSVLSLNYEDDRVVSTVINKDTFGLSAEDILYNVFKVRTTRNYYLDMELREALQLISKTRSLTKPNKSSAISRLEELHSKFLGLVLDKHDPLNTIIGEIDKYLKSRDKKNV